MTLPSSSPPLGSLVMHSRHLGVPNGAGVRMIEYLSFWLAKIFAEFLVALSVGLLLAALPLAMLLRTVVMQWRCKHAKFREDSACDAICCKCGRNLGFILTVREARNKREENT